MTLWVLPLLLLTPAAVPEIELHPLRGLRADVATLILAGRESGALRAAVLATPQAGSAVDATRRVAVWVEVDGASFLSEDPPDGPSAPLRAELYVYAMTPARELAASVGRRLSLPVAELRQSRIKLATYLDLPPGEYQLHVLVRELRSQRFALRLEPLNLAPAGEVPANEAPAIEGGWVVNVRGDLDMSGLGDAAVSGLFAWNPLHGIPGERMAEEPDREAIELSRRASQRVRAAADAYRNVLDRLASGRLDDAVGRLRELERGIGAHEDPERARELEVAQDLVIQELAEDAPESLLPLLVLHRERHVRALQETELSASHAISRRRRIVKLARNYGEKAQTDLAPVLAAAALTEVGASHLRDHVYPIGRRILESALAFDDDHLAALFCLAFVDEFNGRYEGSVETLRRALAVVPGSQEGRLRLALGLRRLGRSDEAVPLLRRLVEETPEDWLLTIAYEELGRLLLGRVGPEAAVELLQEGVARLPEQQRLYAQLSYFLDRSGERQRGREVLSRMPADTGRASPRRRYGEPPCDDGGSRELLLRHSTGRLPELAQALARLRAEEGR